MPLNSYQKHILRDFRADEQVYGVTLWTLTTGAGYSALDAYKQQTWVETDTIFSGAVLWSPYMGKQDTAGGFYNKSDLVIVASRDNKAAVQAKDIKLEFDDIKFRVSKIIDCEDTNEIVIFATRLE